MPEKQRIGSGVEQLDHLLDGLYIGDNVVWHDDAGSLAWVFCRNLLNASRLESKPVIYVSFDRPPKTLLEKLGPLAENPNLIVLDCYTCGKGDSSPVFQKFYDETAKNTVCSFVRVDEPRDITNVNEVLYSIHSKMSGDVRLVFESLTGMQELWGGEDQLVTFYGHACPQLYELETVAYWVLEKDAHTQSLKAKISQIAQVVVELSIKRGTTLLTVLKADGRETVNLHKPFSYWARDLDVVFGEDKRSSAGFELGTRIKELRMKKGISQTELARLIGVTPSTISQVESNLIYPSIPALFKMAEVLGVGAASFFQDLYMGRRRCIFTEDDGQAIKLQIASEGAADAIRLTPIDFDGRAEAYLIDIPPGQSIQSHFFFHKGEEVGYLLSGSLELRLDGRQETVKPGDLISLIAETPAGWKNTAAEPARLFWLKLL